MRILEWVSAIIIAVAFTMKMFAKMPKLVNTADTKCTWCVTLTHSACQNLEKQGRGIRKITKFLVLGDDDVISDTSEK